MLDSSGESLRMLIRPRISPTFTSGMDSMRVRAREIGCPETGTSGGKSGSVSVVMESWMMLTRRWNSGSLLSRGNGSLFSSTRPMRPGRGNTTTMRVAISTASSMLCVTMNTELRPLS